MRLVIPLQAAERTPGNAAPASINAIARGHEWVRQIVAGEHIDQRAIATSTGLNERYVSRIIQSAFLSPEIVEAIVKGRHGAEMSLIKLLEEVSLSWTGQYATISAGRGS